MDGEPLLYPQRKTTYPEIATPELRKQVGKELKSAREFQEMSLEQVMAITKINVRFLEHIEDGKWNFLPPTYAKAFIRAYAASVGLQTEKLSNRLDELFQHVVVSAATFKPNLLNESEDSDSTRPQSLMDWIERNRTILFYSLIGVISATLVVIYLMRPSKPEDQISDDKQEAAKDAIQDSGSADKLIATGAAAKIDTTQISIPSTNMAVEFSFLDTCYMKIEHLDSTYYERTLWPGNSVNLELPFPARLSMGNAPAVRLKIDGQELPAFPGSRRVQVVNIGPGGIIG